MEIAAEKSGEGEVVVCMPKRLVPLLCGSFAQPSALPTWVEGGFPLECILSDHSVSLQQGGAPPTRRSRVALGMHICEWVGVTMEVMEVFLVISDYSSASVILLPVSVGVDAARVGLAIHHDYRSHRKRRRSIPRRTIKTLADIGCSFTGGFLGGYAGAHVGAVVGASIGGLLGGVGAVPGAGIGGMLGGLAGSLGGGLGVEKVARLFKKRSHSN